MKAQHPEFPARKPGPPCLPLLATILSLLVLPLLLMSCAREQEITAESPAVTEAVTPVGATLDEITDDPSAFYGKTVIVSGEVNQLLGARTLTIGGEGFFNDNELLVIGTQPLPVVRNRPPTAPVARDDIVQVTGTVRQANIAEIEREYALDLDQGLFAEFEQKPALIARSILVTPRIKAAR